MSFGFGRRKTVLDRFFSTIRSKMMVYMVWDDALFEKSFVKLTNSLCLTLGFCANSQAEKENDKITEMDFIIIFGFCFVVSFVVF